MIRVLAFLAFLALLALGASWLADRPGEVAVIWQGYRIETSLAVLIAAVLALAFVLVCLWSLMRMIIGLPGMIAFTSRIRRRNRGYVAVSRGMVAVGAGDPAAARRHAHDAERWLGREPLTLLLKAQAAQISGDRRAAEATFTEMLDDAETRVLGLRGLFVEARRKGDAIAARAYVTKAVELAPGVGWANEAMLEFQSAERDWRGALAKLEQRMAHRSIDKATARRQRAVLLTADALDRAGKEPEVALTAVLTAIKLAPDLVPAAALAGRLLSAKGNLRKAAKILEGNWKIEPHPDVAAVYLDLRQGDSTLDRLARAEALARLKPRHPQSLLALAEAAVAAREFERARRTLAALLEERPTVRTCLLMADIEEAEHGTTAALRQWLGRASRAPRDPTWIADGVMSDHWEPVSPVTGRLDAFRWTTPAEQIGTRVETDSNAVIADGDEPAALPPVASLVPAEPLPQESLPQEPLPAEPATPEPGSPPSDQTASGGDEKAGPDVPQPVAEVEPPAKPRPAPASNGHGQGNPPKAESPIGKRATPVVFPVVRPPDDPGPHDADLDEPPPGGHPPVAGRFA
jgi:HemY protein